MFYINLLSNGTMIMGSESELLIPCLNNGIKWMY